MNREEFNIQLERLTDEVLNNTLEYVEYELIEGKVAGQLHLLVVGTISGNPDIRYRAFRMSGKEEDRNDMMRFLGQMIDAYIESGNYSDIEIHANSDPRWF